MTGVDQDVRCPQMPTTGPVCAEEQDRSVNVRLRNFEVYPTSRVLFSLALLSLLKLQTSIYGADGY